MESEDTKKPIEELKKKNKELEDRIITIKKAEFICAGILILLISISFLLIVVLLICSKNESYQEVAEICSVYTGIVLGFVAMTVSLIGMILSFHNTRQAEESNLSINKEFFKLENKLKEITGIEEDLTTTTNNLSKQLIDIKKLKDMEKILLDLSQEIKVSLVSNKGQSSKVSNVKAKKEEDDNDPTDE